MRLSYRNRVDEIVWGDVVRIIIYILHCTVRQNYHITVWMRLCYRNRVDEIVWGDVVRIVIYILQHRILYFATEIYILRHSIKYELVLFLSVESNVPTVLYKMDSNSITFSFANTIWI